jgi:hypothetical protein
MMLFIHITRNFIRLRVFFEHCCEGYALYTQYSVTDPSSSANERYDYVEEEKEELLSVLSSSYFDLQQEDCSNEIHADICQAYEAHDEFDTCQHVSDNSYLNVHPYEECVAESLCENHLLTEKTLVEDHIVDEEEQQVDVDTSDTFSDVSNGQNSNNNQGTYLHSFFQDDHETNVSEFQISEIFSNQPTYDEYDDDLEVLDPDVYDVVGFDQQLHEDIESIVHEEPDPVYDNYVSEGSKEDEDEPLDFHDNIIVLNVVVQGTYEEIQNDPVAFDCDKTNDLQKDYGAKISEQQFCSWHRLELCRDFHDPVAIYIESMFPQVQNVATSGMKVECNSKYKFHITCLLKKNVFLHFFIKLPKRRPFSQ